VKIRCGCGVWESKKGNARLWEPVPEEWYEGRPKKFSECVVNCRQTVCELARTQLKIVIIIIVSGECYQSIIHVSLCKPHTTPMLRQYIGPSKFNRNVKSKRELDHISAGIIIIIHCKLVFTLWHCYYNNTQQTIHTVTLNDTLLLNDNGHSSQNENNAKSISKFVNTKIIRN
jgi:hypothetical protein